jgi:hypothetical protein
MSIDIEEYLSDADLQRRGTVKSVQHRRKLQKEHNFPAGILIGRSRRFALSEIQGWLRSRPTAPVPFAGRRR